MTDPALIERITRSLAFMLRHQPETFDLELDPYGFADLEDVVHALNERLGEPVEEEDVQEAVRSGDRQRYEIQGTRIRALYGHSIPVEPGPSSKPPELLYVAVPEQEVERARRFGLRGGRRRFLHLAITRDDAAESGRRAARDYTVLVIRALDAWEEGISFYDRIALWLAEEVPTHLIEVEGTYHDGTDPLPRYHDGPRPREREHHHGHGRSRGHGHGREQRGGEWRGERGERQPSASEARPRFDDERPRSTDEGPPREVRSSPNPDGERGSRPAGRPERDPREGAYERGARGQGNDGGPRDAERPRSAQPSYERRPESRGPREERGRGARGSSGFRGDERREHGGRRERPEQGGERREAPPEIRREEGPADKREERRESYAAPRQAPPPSSPRPAARVPRDSGSGFGAGLDSREERVERPAAPPEPRKSPPPAPRAPVSEPAPDDRPGFGAGL